MPKEIMPHRPTVEQVKSIGEPRKLLYIKADDLSPEELSALVIQFQNMAPGRVEAWSPEIPPASFTEEAAMQNVEAELAEARGDAAPPVIPMNTGPVTAAEHEVVHAAVDGIGVEAATEATVEGVAETLSNMWIKLSINAGFMIWNFPLSPQVPEDDVKFLVADFHTKLDALNAQYADKIAVDSETESLEPPQAVWPFPGENYADSPSPDFSATGLPIPNDFQNALKVLINQHSIENHLGMPDHIIADLVCTQLSTLAQAVWRTEQWKR